MVPSLPHSLGSKSLSRKLPLLISALLIAALALFSFIAYRQLTNALMLSASARMKSASLRLGSVFEDSGRRLRAEIERIAADSTVIRYTITRDGRAHAGAESSLKRVVAAASPQILGIEVNDRLGRRLLWVDGPTPETAAFLRNRPDNTALPRETTIGPIASDHGILHFTLVAPIVTASRDTTGFVQVYRQISSSQGSQLIGGLIGGDVSVLLGNADRKLWTNLSSVVPGPPIDSANGKAVVYRLHDGAQRVGAAVPIKLTPWLVWADLSTSEVLAPANRFLREMTLVALLLALIGGLAALLISRQITTPLRDITLAAQGIAAGDYSRRVTTSRQDELGVMAQSFNTMAQQVDDSRHGLEARVQERTRELNAALAELRDAHESLVRREKLVMLGQLAGGVGHELRNPLGVMTNALYYLGMVLKEATPDVKEYLGILRTQVMLSGKIVGDLLDFARVKPPILETVSVEQLVNEQLERVGPLETIRVERDLPADLPPLSVDRTQMGQVILNLVTNAVQSMDGNGGTLTLRARAGGGKVKLDVIDTGIGMSPGALEKMFEPLFTTKARGIGLGLAVSRSLVNANGGEISATSELGKGSTVTVELPAAQSGAA